jgi:hypothetical protein
VNGISPSTSAINTTNTTATTTTTTTHLVSGLSGKKMALKQISLLPAQCIYP